MQELAPAPPASTASTASSFASLLAALAAPAPNPSAEWNEDDLADDIASLSYEQALRTHTRHHAFGADETPLQQDRAPEPSRQPQPSQAKAAATRLTDEDGNVAAKPKAENRPARLERNRKSASITIRLNKDEGAQLRERAAEAGLTVSAYLRSCIFEAEALRTQVKDALAQFRSAASTDVQKTPTPAPTPSHTWRTRLFPGWPAGRRAAQA